MDAGAHGSAEIPLFWIVSGQMSAANAGLQPRGALFQFGPQHRGMQESRLPGGRMRASDAVAQNL
jgi:hypothetical protein